MFQATRQSNRYSSFSDPIAITISYSTDSCKYYAFFSVMPRLQKCWRIRCEPKVQKGIAVYTMSCMYAGSLVLLTAIHMIAHCIRIQKWQIGLSGMKSIVKLPNHSLHFYVSPEL